MAINKVVNHGSKSHSGMKNVIGYVLRDDKVREGFVMITGPYSEETITAAGVYKAFLSEKKLWEKDSGRMYAHNVISFHKDEQITPVECLEIGEAFADRFFPAHQSLSTSGQGSFALSYRNQYRFVYRREEAPPEQD